MIPRRQPPVVVVRHVVLLPLCNIPIVFGFVPTGVLNSEFILPATASRSAVLPTAQPEPADLSSDVRSDCPWADASLSLWEDTSTWGGVVPAAGADVTIPEGLSVLVNRSDAVHEAAYGTVHIPSSSRLIFGDAAVRFAATAIVVRGELRGGSEGCRILSSLTITLHGTRAAADEKGIVVEEGGVLDLHGQLFYPTWTRLARAAAAGDDVVYTQHCVNWLPGQEIVVTTTDFKDSREHNRNDNLTLAAVECVSGVGKLTLASPLAHGHYAGWYEYQAEVALLSRTVVVQGAEEDSPPTDLPTGVCFDDVHSEESGGYPCEDATSLATVATS
ncbi:hypothetical protein AB1Y20_006372 [Prymnesium parvum]|uniref:G8 domain-containing protein n=1 Tax=Prymnesium parvum TaxID=97485 RepID=A0AB34J254_PRYPA